MDALLAEASTRGLTIGAPRTWALDGEVDRAAVAATLWREGYLACAPVIPAALIARCHDAIELVRAAGAPPLAAFVFDAPWELAAALAAHAEAAFAGEARLLPAFWAWRVDGDDAGAARGWDPHRDHPGLDLDDEGRPQAIALWVPLTDATADNGCMYVVPAPWDPQYGNPRATAEVMFLQSIRALPARAGAVLGWTSRLLHWGAMARPGSPPRISISFEYQAATAPPVERETFPLGWIPAAGERRGLIDRQWQRHAHIHRGDDEARAALADVVVRLLAGAA
jgi:hypothetical protein